MKLLYFIPIILLCGCSLFPKKVEYFQDKVEKAPVKNETHQEVQKEAALYVAEKTQETYEVAIKENASTNLLKPALESKIVANSLSDSLGKPKEEFSGPAKELSRKLDSLEAKFDSKLNSFIKDNDENAGKKIEGTGLIQMGYFTQFIILAVILSIVWVAVKIIGVLNPAVGVGTKVISGGFLGVSKLLGKGFREIVEGGQKFKQRIEEEIEDPEMKEKILELFKQSHKEKQSRDVQDTIDKLLS